MRSLSLGLLASLLVFCFGSTTQAVVLWTENAESGYGNVVDGTSTTYPLIQSDTVGQGSWAFHLANPSFQDNWFEINQTLTIQADTKLFLLSRLAYATSSQVAKVQMSTNGGATWATTLYSQAGSNGPGEGAFGLKEINLSAYANQSARFRFYYDFTSGSAYTQTDSNVGWFIDDIQIADQLQKIPYGIGNPTNHEQLYLEYINRARANAMVEASRLAAETDPDVVSSYSFFGVTGPNIVNQFQWSVNNGVFDQFAQPLSFNESLNLAADLHTLDMYNNQFQGHDSSSNPPAPLIPYGSIVDRFNAVGYSFFGAAENVYSYADSVVQGHAGFDVDWGNVNNPADPDYNPAFAGQGMQNPAGHRRNLHNGSYKEIGIGVINGTNGSVGPQLVTQDFGNPGSATFITGVVYEDLNGNNFYDLGEGRPGVRIDVDGSAYYAISSDSGGYSVPVVGDGLYDVLFTGGGFSSFTTSANVVGGLNVKVDYLASAITYAADFDGDGDVDNADLSWWQSAYGVNGLADADLDGDSDGQDYLIWQQEYGSGVIPLSAQTAVPEPTSAGLAWATMMLAGAFRRRLRTQ